MVLSLSFLLILLSCHLITRDFVAEVSFINVGQGDCALIQLPGNRDVLIDAGGKEDDYSVGEDTVKPYLFYKGAYDIEYAIASHGHIDHIGGLISLFDVIKIKNLVVPAGFGTTDEAKMLLEKAKALSVPIIYMQHGDALWFGENMSIEAILPDEKLKKFSTSENDNSLMLRLVYGETSFLFTGDASALAEGYAAAEYPDLISAEVLKVSHHGSKTASCEAFLDVVKPRYAYIPVGANYYGHPAKETMQNLFMRDIFYYRADQEGDVTFYFNESKILGIR